MHAGQGNEVCRNLKKKKKKKKELYSIFTLSIYSYSLVLKVKFGCAHSPLD